jgi:exodeoxyribonuclease (lambda-induced)
MAMKVIFNDAPQGSESWLLARKGRITGSNFKKTRDRLKNGDFSKKAILYARDVARMRFGGKPEEIFQNAAMRFGSEQEPFARMAYETTTGYMVREVGFAATDCGWYGLSPDGMIDQDGNGVVEIKTMVGSDNLFETVIEEHYDEYMDQCLGYLLFLDIQWVDLVMWTPDLETQGLGIVIHRIKREDNILAIEALHRDLMAFRKLVATLEDQLRCKAAANLDLLLKAA